ncbi:hypothetical protein MMC21_007856 [Puttea exsequens]|nr:hypothetical protein [Puttea exsequens]
MSTQYDTIQSPYDEIRKRANAHIESANVHQALRPYIANARVLDLACGSGFYSYRLLDWGAASVLGIDISPVMIKTAENAKTASLLSSYEAVSFQVADCAKPVMYEGGPFDIVFAAWLLNYAPTRKDLAEMYANIALNLKDGGHFVAVTVPPTQDIPAQYAAERAARPNGSGALFVHTTGELQDGNMAHCHAQTEVGDVDFDFFHLRRSVYESAAREGGLSGRLEWMDVRVPGEGVERVEGLDTDEEIASYNRVPHLGVLVIAKS